MLVLVALSIASGATDSSRRMADGKEWTTQNLNVETVGSFCYDNAEQNCRQYGRLYTWESAQRGCQLLGDGWRLPTNEEWRSTTAESARMRVTAVKRHTRRCCREGVRASMPYLAAGVTSKANMDGWRRMAFTGRHQKAMRATRGSTTLEKAGSF
jgi:uncharacterized protein (TIGR02145 family)